MTRRILILAVAITVLFTQSIFSQNAPVGARAAKFVVEVATDPSSRHLHFKVDQQPVPNDDLLGYLVEHESKYHDDAVPYVMFPSSLTIQDIGAIEATLNKAGYHKLRLFLSATNSDFAVEIIFGASVPLRTIWEK